MLLSKQEIQNLNKQQKAQLQADASKYHRVFVQNPDGAKILQEWMSAYVLGGFTPDEASLTELAKTEARREFVCMITQKITLAENIE